MNVKTATQTVMFIPELLEAILLHVDMTSLLVSAQRVCKQWFEVMKTSPAIQRALFFRPIAQPSDTLRVESPSYAEQVEHDEKIYATQNPLLQHKFGRVFFCNTRKFKLEATNSLLYLPGWAGNPPSIDAEAKTESGADANPQRKAEVAQRRRRFTLAGASWRRMLVSQPPPAVLGYIWIIFRSASQTILPKVIDPSLYNSSSLHRSESQPAPSYPSQIGLRMGLLYDLIQHHARPLERCSSVFRVTWAWRQSWLGSPRGNMFAEILRQTNVIVELGRLRDPPFVERETMDVQYYDDALKCDDFWLPDIKAVEFSDD